jgi:hypothetical protein
MKNQKNMGSVPNLLFRHQGPQGTFTPKSSSRYHNDWNSARHGATLTASTTLQKKSNLPPPQSLHLSSIKPSILKNLSSDISVA